MSNYRTSIVIDSNKCNEESVTVLDLSKYPKLKSVTIGDNCFMYTNEVIITGLNELESVVIGNNSFTMMKDSFGNNSTRSFHLKNCPVLKELKIGDYSFSDYGSYEINTQCDNAGPVEVSGTVSDASGSVVLKSDGI